MSEEIGECQYEMEEQEMCADLLYLINGSDDDDGEDEDVVGDVNDNGDDGDDYKLPGQIKSTQDDVIPSKASSQEFDLGEFRRDRVNSLSVSVYRPSMERRKWIQQQEQQKLELQRTMPKFLTYLGSKFDIEILKERNQNPVIFLHCVLTSLIVYMLSIVVTFLVGMHYSVIPTVLSTVVLLATSWALYYLPKQTIKDRLQFSILLVLKFAIHTLCMIGLYVYTFFDHIPFHSIPLYILAIYIVYLSWSFYLSLLLTPNFTPFDYPDYQLKFFSERIMNAFFNATSNVDVLSDIAMVQYTILKERHSTLFLIFGITLLCLCVIQYILLLKRVILPTVKSAKDCFTYLIAKIIVLVLTVIILKYELTVHDGSSSSHSHEEDSHEGDAVIVTVIALATTIVNILYQAVSMYDSYQSRQQGIQYFSTPGNI